MRRARIACLIAATAIASAGCGPKPNFATITPSSPAQADLPSGAPLESGIYGFSGARRAEGAPEGVIGECLWVFDESDQRQIAKGNCRETEPGKFRVSLKPGKYVVHGPGGNQPIEIKRGTWIKIMSLVDLPLAP